jgi:hypothetical protein
MGVGMNVLSNLFKVCQAGKEGPNFFFISSSTLSVNLATLTGKKPEPYLRVQKPDAAKDHEQQGDLVLVTWQYSRLESYVFSLVFFLFHNLSFDLSRC